MAALGFSLHSLPSLAGEFTFPMSGSASITGKLRSRGRGVELEANVAVHLTASELIEGVEVTLDDIKFDYRTEIRRFGQVEASELRRSGKPFPLAKHVEGLVMAQLSSQRPWKPIADNRDRLKAVFHEFGPDDLERADPQNLLDQVLALKCGNRAIRLQLFSLGANIRTLRLIDLDSGGLDRFVESDSPEEVARKLSRPGSTKLRHVGFVLALEYLRNVGIRVCKPDVHLCRLAGPERLGLVSTATAEELPAAVSAKLTELAEEAGCNATRLDNLLWLFCACGYGAICNANPKCGVCRLRLKCREGRNREGLSAPEC